MKEKLLNICCAKQLGLFGDFEVVYSANTEFLLLKDVEDFIDQITDEDGHIDYFSISDADIRHTLNEAMVTVQLPAHLRIVGMRPTGAENVNRVYGVVDQRECDDSSYNPAHIYAKVKKSSKYFYQNQTAENGHWGLPFKVRIDPAARVGDNAAHDDYCVQGGPGGQYQLRDVNLFMKRADGVFFPIN